MLSSINLPTIIAQHAPQLLQGLCSLLSASAIPEGTQAVRLQWGNVRLTNHTGSASLTLDGDTYQALEKLSPQRLSPLIRTTLRTALGLFRLALEDHRNGRIENPGELLCCWTSEAHGKSLTRITEAAGLNPRSKVQNARVQAAIHLLSRIEWSFKAGGEQIKGKLFTMSRREVTGATVPPGHRAGTWIVLQLTEPFWKRTYHHYIQCPVAALDLNDRALNVALVALSQRHLKVRDKTLPDVVKVGLDWLIRAAGLSQLTTRGDARERFYLSEALSALVSAGILSGHALMSMLRGKRSERIELAFEAPAGGGVLDEHGIQPNDQPLLQGIGERSDLAAPPPPSDQLLLQGIFKALNNQSLMPGEVSLVRALIKGVSKALPPIQGGKPYQDERRIAPG